MKLSRLLLLCFPLLLIGCKTEHHVSNDSLNKTRVGGEKLMEEKFAGNWKPEDAAWYSAPGETDAKKIAQKEKAGKRSQFEQVVSKSRGTGDEKGSSPWDKRAQYDKEWLGTKEKKTFAWPWQKADLKQKENGMPKQYAGQERVSHERELVAREGAETAKEGDKAFGTKDYDSRRPDITKKEQWQAAKPELHKELNIIEDRSAPKEDTGWSVSDVRKFLNKN
jgi:hypothetical protein